MTLFYMTLVLVAAKAAIIIFLASRIVAERRNVEKTPLHLLYAGTICMLTFLVSRLLYMDFDFFLTRFNTALYSISPAIYVWKSGSFISSVGATCLIWVLDRKVLLNKFKGAFAIIILIAGVLQFLYPVREGSLEDFSMVSSIGILGGLVSLAVPIVFFLLGRTVPGLRRFAWIFSFGLIIYLIGSGGLSQNLQDTILSGMNRDVLYILAIALKIIGLTITAYGLSKIRNINKALIEYYQAKRICIVHRGKIDGAVFMCATCHVFYCVPCKDAIVELENACWNCKAVLDPKKQGPAQHAPSNTKKEATSGEVVIVDEPGREQDEGKKQHKAS